MIYLHYSTGYDMEQPIKKRPKKYLNNADLLVELRKSNEQGRLTEELGKMFLMLVKRYASVPRFSGYSYNTDMQSFALLTLCKVWKGFNADKYNNPFAYFTQIAHNAFHQLDNQERRQRDIRDAILVDQGKNPSFNYAERINQSDDSNDANGDIDSMERHDFDVENVDSEIEEIVQEIHALQVKLGEAPPEGEEPEEKAVD